ncbi:hypothetical protein T484DRAFT_1746854 [Baffinella frigidus]|nr:hypothetical protein T484DRAFT_1746854 [Cryptophyta sp. CCMP2293]
MKILRSAATRSKPAALRVLRSFPRMLTSTPAGSSHTAAQTAAQTDALSISGVESLVDVAKTQGFVGGTEAQQQQQQYLRLAADSSSIPSLLNNRIDASPRLSATQKSPSVRKAPSSKKKPAAWNASFLDFVDSIEEPSMGGV